MRRSLSLVLIATALVVIPAQEAWASGDWTEIGSIAFRSDGTQLRVDRGCDVIRIDLDKLQEVTPDGKVVASVHLDGGTGSWGQFHQTYNTYSATLTEEHEGTLIALTVLVDHAVSEPCGEDVLGFSLSVTGWRWQGHDPGNRLHFSVRTASFDGSGVPLRHVAAVDVERSGAAKLNLCATDTADTDEHGVIDTTVMTRGAWTYVAFDIPHFTRDLHLDGTLPQSRPPSHTRGPLNRCS